MRLVRCGLIMSGMEELELGLGRRSHGLWSNRAALVVGNRPV
jgi:hypothetical protein